MTALVTKHLPLVAGAPDGVKQLRQLIVDLAVSNKLIAAGSADAWQQVRLSEVVASFQNGVSSRGAVDGVSVTVLRLADIKAGEVCLDDLRTLMLDAESIAKYLLLKGDTLVIRVNGSAELVGRFIVYGEAGSALHCDHFIRLRLDRGRIEPRFLKLIGDSSSTRASIQGLFVSTAGQKTVNQGHVGSLAVQLPPLAQQHRIVAKVDELMALCDRLEADQADAEAAHAQLVQALLDSLTQAINADDFRASWQRLSEHFHTLFTTEASIDALKQTVLQLAVMGKLAPQCQDDEPAEMLLKRIQGQRQRLVAAGFLRKQRQLPEVDGVSVPFELPNGWAWTRWESVTWKIGDIDHKMPETTTDGVPFVSPRDFYPGNVIDFDGAKRVSYEDYERLSAKIKAERGDLIYPRYGTIGENVIVDVDRDFLVSYSCAVIKVAHGFIEPMYQFYCSLSACIRRQAKAAENKTTQANVGIKSIQEFLFPLPPLAEQHRIVAKVDELMALCDHLKTQLTEFRQQHTQLATVLVEQALG